jgi:NhaP-type Na+/H+ or K+/H+ antiporter
MTAGAVALVAATVFAWGVLSGRLERSELTAPIVFVGAGVVLHATTTVIPEVEAETVKLLAELTLVWVLFSDAARVDVARLRADAGVYGRLLGLGLPLTVLFGWLVAWALLPEVDVWLALLVGAALAPTDAALGSAVMNNPAVPARIREIVNVESGLNDGIVTPVVMVALAGAAAAEGGHGAGAGHALLELLLGVGVGLGVGLLGGWCLRRSRERGWVDEQFAEPAVLALALVAYTCAVAVGGNGFVAAFVGGVAFGSVAGRAGPREVRYVEVTAGLASLLVWLLFGAVTLPVVVDALTWQVVLYAVLSLTVVRMAPVALVLIGTRLGWRTSLFIGWFGPRGLASVVFGLLAVEELGGAADTAVATIALTVLLSVVVHGVTAAPLSARYAAHEAPSSGEAAAHVPTGRGPGTRRRA